MTPAHWPALSAASVAPVIALYPDLGGLTAIDWNSARPFAASGIVTCGRGKVFVKRHDRQVRTARDLAEEHAFIGHLRDHGESVPQVLATWDGATAVEHATGVYEVHGLCDGDDAYRDAPSWTPVRSVAEARALGQALARQHDSGAGFRAPERQTRLVVAGDFLTRQADMLDATEVWVAQDGRLRAALCGRPWQEDFRRVLVPWHEALRPLLPVLAPAWVHGDFHASNLLWRDGAVSAILDFGLSNLASTVYDLATAIERNALSWLDLSSLHGDIGHADLACAIVDGYASVIALSDDRVRALRQLLPLVHVEFALTELRYFHGITRSAADAELAYSAFLLGHAAWFESRFGEGLLRALR